MSESSLRKKKQQKFLEENPNCYFCGGINPATTIDHVPPKACFPDGYAPEGFEFPACQACNQGTDKQDQIFGLHAMLLDFDESKLDREEDRKKIEKLRRGIVNNYPDALPNEATVSSVNRVGSIITPKPVAVSIAVEPSVRNAIDVMRTKLTHALHFRETGRILTHEHKYLTHMYQPQREGTQDLTAYLMSLLPDISVGQRSNIKNYGDRFKYRSGYKNLEDFFVYQAQFGHGMILWGIARGPGIKNPEAGPLGSERWFSAACGPGASTRSSVD